MPKSVEEILAHAEEYAKRFEEFEPSEATKVDLESFTRMRAVAAAQQRAERPRNATSDQAPPRPNKESRAAMAEAEEMLASGTRRFKNLEDLYKHLGI